MKNLDKEYVKEALKTELELFKLFSIFLVALISGIASMALNGSYNNTTIHSMFFLAAVFSFFAVLVILIIFVRNILIHLKQLKSSKS